MEPLMMSRLGSIFLKVKCLINANRAWSEFLIGFSMKRALSKVSNIHATKANAVKISVGFSSRPFFLLGVASPSGPLNRYWFSDLSQASRSPSVLCPFQYLWVTTRVNRGSMVRTWSNSLNFRSRAVKGKRGYEVVFGDIPALAVLLALEKENINLSPESLTIPSNLWSCLWHIQILLTFEKEITGYNRLCTHTQGHTF